MTPEDRSGYARAHRKLQKLWGKAALYPCIACGGSARDWAYDGTDPTAQGVEFKYSVWPEFYMPMCHSCHLSYDKDRHGLMQGQPRDRRLLCHACDKPAFAAGLCRMHYDRKRRYGGLGPAGGMGSRAPLEERFINYVQVGGDQPRWNAHLLGPCSIWTGYRHVSGFGAIWSGHRLIYAHRLAYEMAYGPIPQFRCVMQKCLNRLCVRADHLELDSPKE
jgi:hypothetical protein